MDIPLIGGVAGGVGTSTLARALRAVDGGIYPGVAPVDLLVARSTMYSLACAQRAVAATPMPPVLAVVADIPRARLSGRMKARMRMTEPYLAGLVVVPFVDTWPDMDDPYEDAERVLATTAAEVPKVLRGFAIAIRRLIDLIRPRLVVRGSIGQSAYPAGSTIPVPTNPRPVTSPR